MNETDCCVSRWLWTCLLGILLSSHEYCSRLFVLIYVPILFKSIYIFFSSSSISSIRALTLLNKPLYTGHIYIHEAYDGHIENIHLFQLNAKLIPQGKAEIFFFLSPSSVLFLGNPSCCAGLLIECKSVLPWRRNISAQTSVAQRAVFGRMDIIFDDWGQKETKSCNNCM